MLLGLTSSCGQNYNSNSADATLGSGCTGIDTTTAGGARLCAAYLVMQNTTTGCFGCHEHTTWSAYKTDAQWVAAGLVVAGNPTGSQLVQKLKNAGGTMPQDEPELSTEDYQKIVDWIQNL